jgi:molecular chaperone HtpG
MLLQGVIDSPDIPLNVSRSYLQSDTNVKKISSHITKKVSSRLEEIARKDRKNFEEKWNDIKVFIEYGMLTDEKFCESAMKYALLVDTEKQYFNFEEYKTLIKDNQTDKDGNLVYLYATDKEDQYTHIKAATEKGYNVLMMNGQLDSHFIGMLEQKFEKSRFARVDADVISNLIPKDNKKDSDITPLQRTITTTLFKSQVPALEKSDFYVSFEALGADENPIVLTQSEYMRRMKEMAAMQPGMSFYGELPDSYNMIINTEHTVIKKVIAEAETALKSSVEPLEASLADTNNALEEARKDDNKKDEASALEKKAEDIRNQENKAISDYAASNDKVKQLVDIALLGNGLLKGEALNNFLKRSINLL